MEWGKTQVSSLTAHGLFPISAYSELTSNLSPMAGSWASPGTLTSIPPSSQEDKARPLLL